MPLDQYKFVRQRLYRATKVSSGIVMDFLIPEDEVETYRRAGYNITAPSETELKRLMLKRGRNGV